MKGILLAMAVSTALVSSGAERVDWKDPSTGITWRYVVKDGEAVIENMPTELYGDLTVPSTVDGYAVSGIGDAAFYWCRISGVTISEGIRTIGDSAFWECRSLCRVSVPASVTNIASTAFVLCNKAQYEVAQGNARYRVVDNMLLEDETKLVRGRDVANVTIPAGVTDIGDWSFYEHTNLKAVEIPDSVRNIGGWAFESCDALESVAIPGGVTNIAQYAFLDCSGLGSGGLVIRDDCVLTYVEDEETNVVIPDGVRLIAGGAFGGCRKITSVKIPQSVNTICKWAFNYCSLLRSVELPAGLTQIGDGTFWNCTSLESVTIPDGVTSIGTEAFEGCTALGSVSIPASVTSVGAKAFLNCTNIRNVTAPNKCGIDFGSVTNLVIAQGTTTVAPKAFFGSTSLTSVEIPDSVTSIGEWSFYKCTGLRTVEIPTGVTSIGPSAFYDCTNLTNVTISVGVADIGDSAFKHCGALADLSLPPSVTNIGRSAFGYCVGLTSVTVPEGVLLLGDAAFDYCTGLTEVTVPSTVHCYADPGRPFRGCCRVEEFRVTGSNPRFKVEDGMLLSKDGTVLWVGVNRPTVSIPDGVTTLYSSAFAGREALEHVSIPACLTQIWDGVFRNCSSLTNVVFLGDAPSADDSCFCNVASGCKATVRSDAKGWDNDGDGKWKGLVLAYRQNGDEPFPDLGDHPTSGQIEAALKDVEDEKLRTCVTNAETYAACRRWANKVGYEAVKNSKTAWMSFALGCDGLLTTMPTTDDLTIESFTPSGEATGFDFTVSIVGVKVGEAALAECLKHVFTVQGATSLDTEGFSSANVDVTFGEPEDGMVRFMVAPSAANETSKCFFMKVELTP